MGITTDIQQPKSQVEVDENVMNLLGGLKIRTADDLVLLKNKIRNFLEFRPYTDETKSHADSIQWKRTASQIIQDGYVYKGKACSDMAVIFLALCRAAGIEGQLVKLTTGDKKETHSIVEVGLNSGWYRLDPSSPDSVPFEGRLSSESIYNKKFRVWKKGRDVWDLGLDGKGTEEKLDKE